MRVERLGCPHEDCADYGELGRGNVAFQARYGSGRWALLRCGTCGRTFSERKWTPFFRLQIPETKLLDVLERLSKGHSVRKVAAAVQIDKNTVLKALRVALQQPRWFQVSLPRDFGWDPARAEAVFTFIHERKRRDIVQRRLRPSRAPT